MDKPKPVEAYECRKCGELIIGSEDMAREHQERSGLVLPKGLVFHKYMPIGSDEGDNRVCNTYNVIISQTLNKTHDSENDYYVLGSGNFELSKREESQKVYWPSGQILHLNSSFLRSGQIRLLTQEEFEKEIARLRGAETGFVEKELNFLNQKEGTQGIHRLDSWFSYRGKQVERASDARIDRFLLERQGIGIEALVRTAPELVGFF